MSMPLAHNPVAIILVSIAEWTGGGRGGKQQVQHDRSCRCTVATSRYYNIIKGSLIIWYGGYSENYCKFYEFR
jgi:hypothetical protein